MTKRNILDAIKARARIIAIGCVSWAVSICIIVLIIWSIGLLVNLYTYLNPPKPETQIEKAARLEREREYEVRQVATKEQQRRETERARALCKIKLTARDTLKLALIVLLLEISTIACLLS